MPDSHKPLAEWSEEERRAAVAAILAEPEGLYPIPHPLEAHYQPTEISDPHN